ncbi:CRAL TRIO domain [Curvularia clavata]|uniref:CRAL TRIO domain n=1 Tax=Curvularia clavata TaxID=95742 RepID=A0A9Q9DNM8_CURCL|nr:CRAL TRIO domain [Curvularia clavata]
MISQQHVTDGTTQVHSPVEATLTPAELQAFQQLKQKCHEAGYSDLSNNADLDNHIGIDDDITLLRFLRARKFDVDGAYAQFAQARELHKSHNIIQGYDTIDIQDYEEAKKLYPHWTGRRDKRGLPICFFDISHLDAQRMKGYSRSADEVRRALTVHDTLTRFVLPLCSMAGATTPISSCLYIVDISTFGLKQAWSLRKYTQDISKLLATSYPEVIDRVWVVGAPSYFPTIWGWIKGWIDPVTAAKLVFVSAEEALGKMAEVIEHDCIPSRYGGSFEFEHGALPVLDEALTAALTWLENGARRLPRGPLKWARDNEGKQCLMAVGTENGVERRERVAVVEVK